MTWRAFALGTAICLCVTPIARIGAQLAVFDGTSFAQLVEETEQQAQQAATLQSQLQILQQQLTYATQNMVTAPNQTWGQAQSDLQALALLTGQANTVTYASGNIAGQFQQTYPGYQGAPASQQYTSLITSNQAAQQAALQAAGLQVVQMNGERSTVQQIQAMSAGSPGALQALQAGNMLVSQLIDQMQKTRLLLIDQTTAETNVAAARAQTDANNMASLKSFAAPYVRSTVTNQPADGTFTWPASN